MGLRPERIGATRWRASRLLKKAMNSSFHPRNSRRPRPATGCARLCCLAAALALAGCARPQVIAFAVPPLTCPGGEAVVTWAVEGRASLRVTRADDTWDEGEVFSKGQRRVVTREATRFLLTALDARPEEKNAYAMATLDVPDGEREAPAECQGSQCRASFEIGPVAGLRVLELSRPTLIVGGQERPARVCATSPAGQRSCVDPEGSLRVDTPAPGPWLLEADSSDGDSVPPRIHLHLAFSCPASPPRSP
jgi:hypothetical protein